MTIIVAIGERGEIGREGGLCWHIREDLQHFKALTLGAVVVMGRKTWESLPKRPLPGRRNIVITHRADYRAEGADVAGSLQEALAMAGSSDVYIIGGASVYAEALPHADRLELTLVRATDPAADTFFPSLDVSEWRETVSEDAVTADGLRYSFKTLLRK